MAEKQSNKDRLKEITDSIEDGIKDLFQSEKYAEYLRTMSRFPRYSVNNQMLIFMQNPNATHVAGFNRWKNEFGRNVIKGEHGIKIIAPTPYKKKVEREKLDPDTKLPVLDADGKVIFEEKTVQIPMYKPVTVFDVAQTEGKPLPQLAENLTGNVKNYEIFMEALRRSSPVPIEFEHTASNMDGYFDLTSQRIAIREGMSEVQTVSAAIHEVAHSKLHNTAKTAEQVSSDAKKLTRNTEEVQAESISYSVCAYYGIATGANSFGYIAAWSKDKTLPELRESLEIINKTSNELITDIDLNYDEIIKERETELIGSEPTESQELLFTVGSDKYLHVQRSDECVDYTFYDKSTGKEIDGGQMEMQGTTLSQTAFEICKFHEYSRDELLAQADIEILEELQAANDAAIAIEPPVEEVKEPVTDVPPDPAVSIEARNAYGYMDDVMLPLTKDRALELFERDVPVYLLYTDSTEAMAFDTQEIIQHEGIFGIDRADWDLIKENEAVIQTNKWVDAFARSASDSYCIYQLKSNEETAQIRFMNTQYLKEHEIEPSFGNYDAVYAGTLETGRSEDVLENLYMKFNTDHPQDFTGHSLSVSDIVALKQNGGVNCYYVDSVGFTQIPSFLPDNYLKNAEVLLEDDYGMIDGILNNSLKDQAEPQRNSPDLSALFAQAQKIAGEETVKENDKKESVLEKLHTSASGRTEKEAQTKSAERELI